MARRQRIHDPLPLPRWLYHQPSTFHPKLTQWLLTRKQTRPMNKPRR